MKAEKFLRFLVWMLIGFIMAASWIITEIGMFVFRSIRKLYLLIYYDLFPEMKQEQVSFNSEEYKDVVYNIGEDYDRLTV